jgi:hypothetical protein
MSEVVPALTPEHAQALDHDLISVMPGGVVYIRADGSIAAANAEAQRILGLQRDALMARYIVDFETETLREDGSVCPVAEYPVSRALATGEAQPGVTIGIRHPDGSVKWALFRAAPVKDPATGAVTGAIVTFLDVSERMRVEDELRSSGELFTMAQELAKVGAWEWDMLTGEVRWTDQNLAIHGIRREEFDGTLEASTRYVHPEDRDAVNRGIGAASTLGFAAPTGYRIVRPDGTVVDVLAWGAVVRRDAAGNPTKMVGATQDVTQLRQLEGQLRHAQRMESVGLLAGGIAHDFNNLLQIISANVDIGLRGRVDVREALGNVQLAAQRAAELTRQLLTFSRRQPFHARRVDLNEVMGELMRLLPRLLGDGVQVTWGPSSDLPDVQADAGLLHQVMLNLCINARDAMPDGGQIAIRAHIAPAPHTLRVRKPEQEHCVMIEVTDTGSGMSAEVASRVFEPFFTTKPVGQGTGLGLSVVYGIIEQHGGAIDVQTELGLGTVFRVYLPIADGASAASPLPPAIPNSAPAQGGRVLVVEDEESVRSVVVALLRDEGYDVVEATDGLQALRVFEENPDLFAMVLTDIMMPNMGGIELVRRLRLQRPTLPIVFTTGYTVAPTELEGECVLPKPYEIAQLFGVLAGLRDRP